MEGSKTLLCSSKFSWARGRISSKFIGNRSRALRRFSSPAIGGIYAEQKSAALLCCLPASLIRVIFHEVVCGSSTPLSGEPSFHRSAPLLKGSLKRESPFKMLNKNRWRLYSLHIPF
jgi:hypothetical protein